MGTLRVVAGFRREVGRLVGAHPLADGLVDAAIEAVRLTRHGCLRRAKEDEWSP